MLALLGETRPDNEVLVILLGDLHGEATRLAALPRITVLPDQELVEWLKRSQRGAISQIASSFLTYYEAVVTIVALVWLQP